MTETEYNSLVDMFNSDGWKVFISQVEETEDAATKGAVNAAETNDSWQFLRGWISCARGTAAYETFVRLSYEEQLRQEEEDDADV